mmetsp:Transcript_9720/g.19246  ORF Transcript_9720/g.19246 Transcript_9720/m.19246 type:complete len:206 (-) Transcript_9720:27-644(-)
MVICLTISLGNTFYLILLLDCIRVGRSLGGIDQLISQALGNSLDVTECSLTSSSCQKPDGLVHAAEWRHINRLTANHTGTSNTGGIFTWPTVDDSVNKNLNWVLVCEQVDDIERVLDNTDSHQFLSIVTSVHHQTADEPLHNWALGLSEALLLITTSGMSCELGILWLHSNIILQGDIIHLDIIETPFSKQLDLGSSHGYCVWQL